MIDITHLYLMSFCINFCMYFHRWNFFKQSLADLKLLPELEDCEKCKRLTSKENVEFLD